MMDELVKEKIRTFYERMNFELRSLERFKRKVGICTMGISCMSRVLEGKRGCALHVRREKSRKDGHEVERIGRYSTDYGRIRKKEIPLEREAKILATKSPRRAAKRAA